MTPSEPPASSPQPPAFPRTPLNRRPRPTEITLHLPQLPDHLQGLRVLHLTDIHTTGMGPNEQLVLDALRQCDLAVFTGDLAYPAGIKLVGADLRDPRPAHRRPHDFELDPHVSTALDVATRLFAHCPVPLIASQGNHDPDILMRLLDNFGAIVLANESVTIDIPHRGPLQAVGIRCASRHCTDIPAAFAHANPDAFTLAACHYPELAPACDAAGAHLILSGHTHGGQLCLPSGRPLLTHSRTGRHLLLGQYQLTQATLYTSPGIGATATRFRTFCPAQLPTLTLQK